MASKKQSVAGEALGLFTDFVQGIRQELKKRGGTDKQLELLRQPAIIAAIVSLITVPVQAVLQFLDRTIRIVVDGSKDLSILIAAGNYDWVNPDILKHWVLSVTGVTGEQEAILLCYNKNMSSEAVRADMERQGLRPGTDRELLELGAHPQHCDLQRQFPIVELGTVLEVVGLRLVLCLGRYDRERNLYLYLFLYGWDAGCRFLAFRKSALGI